MKILHASKYVLAISLFFYSAEYSHAPNTHWTKWSIDSSGNGADGIHTSDINKDAFTDVVSGWEQSGQVYLYLNPGKNKVTADKSWPRTNVGGGVEIEGIEDAAFADLDLDGNRDAVIPSIEGSTKTIGLHWSTGLAADDLEK